MVKNWQDTHPEAIIQKKNTELIGEEERNRKTPKGFRYKHEQEVIKARLDYGLTEG